MFIFVIFEKFNTWFYLQIKYRYDNNFHKKRYTNER